jgi:hypothetical protein
MEKLPKYWYVVTTEQNQEVLSEWRFGKSVTKIPIGAITGMHKDRNTKEWDYKLCDRWENEITFHQFQKWVWNIEVEPDYEIY